MFTEKGFLHDTVCHKYEFKDPITGVHTQHVKNYINRIKMEIKKRKGIKSGQQYDYLFEIVWQLNFSNCEFEKLFRLINKYFMVSYCFIINLIIMSIVFLWKGQKSLCP